jgi:hypothetical protein
MTGASQLALVIIAASNPRALRFLNRSMLGLPSWAGTSLHHLDEDAATGCDGASPPVWLTRGSNARMRLGPL